MRSVSLRGVQREFTFLTYKDLLRIVFALRPSCAQLSSSGPQCHLPSSLLPV